MWGIAQPAAARWPTAGGHRQVMIAGALLVAAATARYRSPDRSSR